MNIEYTHLVSSCMHPLNLIFMKQSLSSHDKLKRLMNGFHIGQQLHHHEIRSEERRVG